MPILDLSNTIRDKMNGYSKEDLTNLAYSLDMSGISRLKDAELSAAITEKILDPNTMFYRMSIFDDKAIRLFEKAIGNLYEYSEDEYDTACVFDEMDYAFMDEGFLFVPQDVAKAWKAAKTKEFDGYRQRASWVWKCLYWVEEMYVYAPIEIFAAVCNAKKGFHISNDELISIFDHFPLDQLWMDRIDNVFLSSIYIDSESALSDLVTTQAGKDFYIPTADEVEELFDTLALLSRKPYQDMLKFMTCKLHMPNSEAMDILNELWHMISENDDLHDAIQWFLDQFVFDDESLLEEIVRLYIPLANGTRMPAMFLSFLCQTG